MSYEYILENRNNSTIYVFSQSIHFIITKKTNEILYKLHKAGFIYLNQIEDNQANLIGLYFAF